MGIMNRVKCEEMVEGRRWFYTFLEKNGKGEEVLVEICKIHHGTGKNDLPTLWKKNGYTDRLITDFWSVHTNVTQPDGLCYGRYNPQHVTQKDVTVEKQFNRATGKYEDKEVTRCRNVLNFDWLLEPTEENLIKLLEEIERRAFGGDVNG